MRKDKKAGAKTYQMRGFIILFIFVMALGYAAFAQKPECDYKVEIIAGDEEFEKGDFKWRMKATKIEGKPTNISGTAKIEDSNGKRVKSYKPWTSAPISKQKTSREYSPRVDAGRYKITAEINVECSDINKDNNIDAKKIKIEGGNKATAKRGGKDVKSVNNGISNKNVTRAGSYTRNIITAQPKKPVLDGVAAQKKAAVIENPEQIYASSNEKAKEFTIIFLLVLSVLLNIILIWKR